jgi:cytochrome c2
VKTFVSLMLFVGLSVVAAFGADARRGAIVFEQQKCNTCHATSGKETKAGPNFGQRLDRDYTPAGMASRMWNHAPRMWAAIREAKLDIPRLTETDAADLFAFFYARRFFERRGDAARGKRDFEDKCAECHTSRAPGKPVTEWESLADPVELAQRLWNHSPEMLKALEARKRHWPQLSSAELTDLLVYVQNLSENKSAIPTFSLPTGARGKELLESKRCTECHKGSSALEGRLGNLTLTDIAAAMWDHAPKMREKATELSVDEMREILAYVWSTDFYRSRGNVAAGSKVFSSRCATCHGNPAGGAPDLKAVHRPYTAITMVWVLWNHGPKMLQQAEKLKKSWPELSQADMDNLIAFLDSVKK